MHKTERSSKDWTMFKHPFKSRFTISSCEIFKHTFTRWTESHLWIFYHHMYALLQCDIMAKPAVSSTWNSTVHKPSNSTWRRPSCLSLPMLSFSKFFVDQRSKRRRKNLWTWLVLHSPFKATYIWSSNTRTSVKKHKFISLILLFRFFCTNTCNYMLQDVKLKVELQVRKRLTLTCQPTYLY